MRTVSTNNDLCGLCHARNVCPAAALNLQDKAKFQSLIGHRKTMRKGELLYMAGEHTNTLFIVHSGSVKTFIESSQGENQITGFHWPGEIIGLHGVEQRCHTDSVSALEASSVCEIKFHDFNQINAALPALHDELLRFVFREMDHEQFMMLVLGKLSAKQRLAYFLLDVSTRAESRGLSGTKLNLPMSRNDIANYLGLAVETVSRILSKLQSAGIIRVARRTVEILDMSELKTTFNGDTESDSLSDPLQVSGM